MTSARHTYDPLSLSCMSLTLKLLPFTASYFSPSNIHPVSRSVSCDVYWLAHCLAFGDPYSHFSVDVSVCVCSSANTMLNISETRGSCPIGSPQESACDASICDLIDDVTRLYDVKHVIFLKSRHSKSSHLETRIRVRVDPLSTHYRRTWC